MSAKNVPQITRGIVVCWGGVRSY